MSTCPKCNTKLHGVYVPGGSSSTERTESTMTITTAMKCYACGHYQWDEPAVVKPSLPIEPKKVRKVIANPAPLEPKPDGRGMNMTAIKEKYIKIVRDNYQQLVTWRVENRRTLPECCELLAERGISISIDTLCRYMQVVKKEQINA